MESTLPQPRPFRISDWVVDRRVPISFVAFVSLIIENVASARRPHLLTDWHDPWTLAGLTTIVLGLCIRSWAAGVLRKGVGLATDGPYRLCRHPLYLGSWLMMAGFCSLLNDVLYLVVMLGPISLIYYLTIEREERRLAQRYGATWTRFAAESSRIIPLRWPRGVVVPWSLAQWLKNREYQALVTTVVALAAIYLWGRN